MAYMYRHSDGHPYAADLRPDGTVTLELLPDTDYGVLKFRDEVSSFHVIVPRPVFAQLATIIRSAGLAGAEQ